MKRGVNLPKARFSFLLGAPGYLNGQGAFFQFTQFANSEWLVIPTGQHLEIL